MPDFPPDPDKNPIPFDNSIDVVQPTELGQALSELNDDKIDSTTRMNSLDMRSRLAQAEINSILAIDTLVALKVLPSSCLAFTRQKKRLNVSQDGLGRREMVESIVGKRDQDNAASGLKGWFNSFGNR